MTVGELIEQLQAQPIESEVRLAIQPSWPFEHRIAGVAGPAEALEYAMEEAYAAAEKQGVDLTEIECPNEAEMSSVVYIGEGGQIGYLPGAAKGAFEDNF